ncbi:hypothetical protein SAMN05421630_10687 [Prauserella marina]|uniref:Uncharacterized protein n=1 Tax=Prauserella marina TaxID=530584 RepID=A0A1G6SCN0_9PSEU|nr:hypothetical protein [Prauserella marina]PWV81854.1 hypothetical protein DES30_10287 [Prauserella marina]SDD13897.1 hypothetical protein SAMN05421630_10687 [Prauserella marina]
MSAAAITLSACGGGEEGDASAAPETSASAAAPSDEVAADDSSEAPAPAEPGSAEVTPPGTALKVGDRAVVPFESSDATGKIAITVTAIEPGDKAEFESKFGDKAQGIDPVYIRYTIENVEGGDFSYSSAPRLRALGADGTGTGVIVSGDLGTCESDSAPKDFTAPGATYETCRLQGGTPDNPAVGVEYSDDDYSDDPIVWTA